MKGSNTLVLNEATMIGAVQFWLDSIIKEPAPKVVSVSVGREGMSTLFNVSLKELKMADIITPEQRNNLLKLADHLLNKPLKAEFDMGLFCPIALADSNKSVNICGTVGCALGHTTYIIEEKSGHETWDAYSERLFGLSKADEEWSWCFGSLWTSVDNSPQGAAYRIRYMLGTGGIPQLQNWPDYTSERWEALATTMRLYNYEYRPISNE